MKKLLQLCLVCAAILFFASACNLSKTAVVRDTVKTVATTTADYFSFYHPAYGEGKLKDVNRTIANNRSNPDLPIRIVAATAKQDVGYFLIKPATASGNIDTSLSTAPQGDELVLKLSDFQELMIPQRGN